MSPLPKLIASSSLGEIYRLVPDTESTAPQAADQPQPSANEQAPEPWPVIDKAAYHGLAGDFALALDPHTEADPAGILIQSLTVFGNIVGNSPYYLVESDRHHANLFVIEVGTSAKGRKGTGANRVREMLQEADAAWFTDRIASGLSSGEGLIFPVRDPVK